MLINKIDKMKKTLKITAVSLLISLFSSFQLTALTGFGFYAGLSTPNDKVNDVYNKDNIQISEDIVGDLMREGTQTGYCIGIKGRFELSNNFTFKGGIGWNKFPRSDIEIVDSGADTSIGRIKASTNVVPISVGFNYYVFKSFLGVYGTGELTYNYISNAVETPMGIDMPTGPTDSRVGFGIGAGVDFDLPIITLNVEAKYNFMNLIGKVSGEEDKRYVTLSLGVVF